MFTCATVKQMRIKTKPDKRDEPRHWEQSAFDGKQIMWFWLVWSSTFTKLKM